MARYDPVKNSFVAGELSPRLEGRNDIEQLSQGMRRALNVVVFPQGGCYRRAGSRFVNAVSSQSLFTRLLKFVPSVDQAYVIEAGLSYMQFYSNEGILVGTSVTTSFTTADLADIHTTQVNDVMWLASLSHYPAKLSRTSSLSFTLAPVTFRGGAAPMRPDNLTPTTVTISGTSSATTISFSTSGVLSTSNDVGRDLRAYSGDATCFFTISAVPDTQHATGTFTSTSPTISTQPTSQTNGTTAIWALGMFSKTEGPRTVALHQGRLGYFGSTSNKNWFALSDPDDFDDFNVGGTSVTDSDAILRPVNSGRAADAVQWAAAANGMLVIGSSDAEYSMPGDATTGVVTPSSNNVSLNTHRGSAHIQAVVIDNEIAFVQFNQRRIRVFAFDQLHIQLTSRDISVMAEHLLLPGINGLEFQQDTESIIWIVRADGVLVGFTYDRDQKVNGGHRHIFGGVFNDGGAVVESMTVIPSPDNSHDQCWFIVKRLINGNVCRYIEFFMPQFRSLLPTDATALQRAIALEGTPFSDCSLTLNAPIAIASISGTSTTAVFSTSGAHGLTNGNTVRLRNLVSLVSSSDGTLESLEDLNNVSYTVSGSTSATFTLVSLSAGVSVGSPTFSTSAVTDYQPYLSGGSVYKETQLITGLSHVANQTVDVQADGAAVGPLVVSSSGAISLPAPASIVHVGLNYISQGETMKFIGGGKIGSDAGRRTRIQRIIARVMDTIGVEWRQGPNPARALEATPVMHDQDPMDRTPPLFTGDIDLAVGGSWLEDPTVFFQQSNPLPMTILSLMPSAESRER